MSCNNCQKPPKECKCSTVTYNPCAKDSMCIQKIDAECVIYQFSNPNGLSELETLRLPTLTNLKQFMVAVDRKLASLLTPVVPTPTPQTNNLKTVSYDNDLQNQINNLVLELDNISNIINKLQNQSQNNVEQTNLSFDNYKKGITLYNGGKNIVSGELNIGTRFTGLMKYDDGTIDINMEQLFSTIEKDPFLKERLKRIINN